MAQLNALQLVNAVLTRVGEPVVAALTSLTGQQLFAFDVLNDTIQEIGLSNRWKSLEEKGEITMGSGTDTYAQDSDMADFDTNSFRYDESKKIEYRTPQEFDRAYPTQTDTGEPVVISEFGGFWYPYKIPNVSAHGKIIKYRHWTIPIVLSTATEAGFSWFPEGFDLTVLVNLAVFKMLHYRGNAEAAIYFQKVYGDPKSKPKLDGSITRMKRAHSSPMMNRIRVTAHF